MNIFMLAFIPTRNVINDELNKLLSRVSIHDFAIRWFIRTYLFVKMHVYLFNERRKKKRIARAIITTSIIKISIFA